MSAPADDPPAVPLQSLPGDVTIVPLSLEDDAAEPAALERLLSVAERARAARLAGPVRRRFVAARGQLRRILGRILDDDPAAIELDVGARGKPVLGGRHSGRCHFNISHAQDRCLLALSPRYAVGIDLEFRTSAHTAGWAAMMAGSILAEEELASYGRLPDAERPRALLEAWVVKEALLKATAEGISGGVRHLVLPVPLPRTRLVTAAVPCDVALAAVAGGPRGTWGVSLLELDSAGFAAVACAAAACRLALLPPGRFGIGPG